MIRTSARAVIIRDRELLTVVYRFANGLAHVLPGGGQQRGECLRDTVQRECLEEIGTSVKVDRLLYVREFIPENHGFTDPEATVQQGVDFLFSCRIPDGYVPRLGELPDPDQAGVARLPIDHLEMFNFYPMALKSVLAGPVLIGPIVDPYLGDVN